MNEIEISLLRALHHAQDDEMRLKAIRDCWRAGAAAVLKRRAQPLQGTEPQLYSALVEIADQLRGTMSEGGSNG